MSTGSFRSSVFVKRTVSLQIVELKDEWFFRFGARAKTIAVSLGLAPRWPWEQGLFGDSKSEGIRETIKLPQALLLKLQNAREIGPNLIKGESTVQEMKRIFLNNEALLRKFDPTIALDFEVLDEIPQVQVLTKEVTSKVLCALPTEATPCSPSECLNRLEVLKRSPAVTLMGVSSMSEVSGVAGMVRRFSTKDAPGFDEFSKLSDFYRCCLKRMVNFYSVDIEHLAGVSPCKLNFGSNKVKTFGLKAFEWSIGKAQTSVKAGEVVKLEFTEAFRQFEFSLTEKQRFLTDQWIRAAIEGQRKLSVSSKGSSNAAIADSKDGPSKDSKNASSSYSALSLSLASATSKRITIEGPSSKKRRVSAACEVDKGLVGAADMLQFFGKGILKPR